MKHEDFELGMEFSCGPGRWRVTDIGMRTVIAIKLSDLAPPDWYEGPPYSVAEMVFDEDDFAACEPSIQLKPTAFGKRLLETLRAAAKAEAQRHLEAGRTVHGTRDGVPIAVEPGEPAYLLGAEISGGDFPLVAFWDANGMRHQYSMQPHMLWSFEHPPAKFTHVRVRLLMRDGANESCLIRLTTVNGFENVVVPCANVRETVGR